MNLGHRKRALKALERAQSLGRRFPILANEPCIGELPCAHLRLAGRSRPDRTGVRHRPRRCLICGIDPLRVRRP